MIKVHQYTERFEDDLRFWIETTYDNRYYASWLNKNHELIEVQELDESVLLKDLDRNAKFYYNGELK